MKPFVSIICNCHNASNYISDSVKSALNQSYTNWELIIYDNFSRDETFFKIKNFLKDKRIKYFKSKSFLNLYNARNQAIKKSRGKYLAFLDADDWWHKEKLTKQVAFIKRKKSNIIYSNLYLFYENEKKIKLFSRDTLYNGMITQSLLNDFKMPILTTLIKKKIFKKISFNKKYNIIGDFDLFVKLSLKEKIYSMQEPLAYYRLHESNLTRKRLDLNINEIKSWIKEHEKKKKFSHLSFSKLKMFLETLLIKKYLIEGNKLKVIKLFFKQPSNLQKYKFLFFLFLPKKIIDKYLK